ncbi:Sua5/YciO/YrdC/YwlC family protein, partial [Bacteroidota bacterium]
LSAEEKEVITSWRRPILLLKRKAKNADIKDIAFGVCVGFSNIGVMLPYMPFHHLLFEKLELPALVLTSGNISDEPIIISDDEAINVFGDKVDAIVTYNRDIHNRTDDSVSFVENEKERIIRRSRGHVPNPINLKLNTDGIIAAGAELVNCFCIGKGNQAILSQHIGDLKNLETLEFYTESLQRLMNLFRMKPELAVCDLHPDYLSSQHINQMGIPVIGVQHHHAHIASVMAEFGIDEKVIGIAFDGVGLGTDNKIWGGEFLLCDLVDFERPYHFEYIPMPGGDKATEEPWRMALSYLYKYFGDDLFNIDIPFIRNLSRDKAKLIIKALDLKINCPETSSAGRLFDAVSALIGSCKKSTFHAEAPMRLEAAIDFSIKEKYSYFIEKDSISFKSTFSEIINDLMSGKANSYISTKFHNTIIYNILEVSKIFREKNNINKVVLSGGSFQNRYILRKAENLLKENGFEVYSPLVIPANDGGIALGQLAIAAKRRETSFAGMQKTD